MKGLRLVRPTKEYEKQAYEYINEFVEFGSQIHGVGGLNKYIDDYDGWLLKLEQNRNMVPGTVEGRVPSETFILIREEDNKMLGIIDIRLMLNDYLLSYGGHIGYGIRPSERRKGYASYQLYLGLKFCLKKGLDRVLITCDKDNVGSAKTIINAGGILENEIILEDGRIHQRYWVDLEENVARLSKKYKKTDYS